MLLDIRISDNINYNDNNDNKNFSPHGHRKHGVSEVFLRVLQHQQFVRHGDVGGLHQVRHPVHGRDPLRGRLEADMLIVDGGDENMRRLRSALQRGGELELVLVSGPAGGEEELGEVAEEGLLTHVVPVHLATGLQLHVGLRVGGEGRGEENDIDSLCTPSARSPRS